MQATPEQESAIYIHDKNLIVTAGAGSGKTRVLVERCMKLLAANPTWRLPMIVSITFTEKAAREMRERIRGRVQDYIQAATDAEERQFWQLQQATLDAARISTVHRLCAQILRANPVEAALDPGFTVLDEVDASLLIREAVDLSLSALIEQNNPHLAALLIAYEVQSVRAVLQDYAARTAAQRLSNALANQTEGSLRARWADIWEQQTQAQVAALQSNSELRSHIQWIHDRDGAHLQGDKLYDVWQVVKAHEDILLFSESVPDVLTAVETLKRTISARGGAQKFWGSADVVQESRDHLKAIKTILSDLEKDVLPQPNDDDAASATLLLHWHAIISHVHQQYELLKEERNVLDFDDLEERTAHLLEHFPAVANRYAHSEDGEFKHIMVDEFQDTNDNQRRIVYALAGVDLETQTSIPGRLFVVGDPKQSIYAFRGADVSVFERVRREILATGGAALALTKSFRSHKRLVDTFNMIFADVLQQDDTALGAYSVGYDFMDAHRDSAAYQQTTLRLDILQKPETDEQNKKSSVSTEDIRRWEAHRIATYIQQQVADGVAQYGDFAMLFQTMTNIALYEAALQQLDVPYVTVAGRGYFDRQEVWDLMNLLAVLHRPMDDLALATVLRSPLFALSDDGLFALRLRWQNNKQLALWDALLTSELHPDWPPIEHEEDVASIQFAQSILPKLYQLTGRVTIAELLQTALEQTGYEAIVVGLPNGERRRANIRKLLKVAQQSEHITLSDFNARLRDMVAVEAREGEATLETDNVVQLMSVHKSKGLEFPIVIIPDASWTRRTSTDTLTVDPQLGAVCKFRLPNTEWCEPTSFKIAAQSVAVRDDYERRRLLYVAMTRAEDLVVLSGADSKQRKGWLALVCDALSTADYDLDEVRDPCEETLHYTWGDVALHVGVVPEQQNVQAEADDNTTQAEYQIYNDRVKPMALPLLQKPHIQIPAERLHVQATDLERFGHIRFEDPTIAARREFRLRLLRNLPGPVHPISPVEARHRRLQTVKGNTLHHALQVGLLPIERGRQVVEKALHAYVWEQGVGDDDARTRIVKESIQTLLLYENSSLKQQLDMANQVYREIAFVFEYGRYVIHGIIDVLFEVNGAWYVVDHKSGRPPRQELELYAERYIYQLGAYALAVEAQTGKTPNALIHFLHYNKVVTITAARWREAMSLLDSELKHALNEEKI